MCTYLRCSCPQSSLDYKYSWDRMQWNYSNRYHKDLVRKSYLNNEKNIVFIQVCRNLMFEAVQRMMINSLNSKLHLILLYSLNSKLHLILLYIDLFITFGISFIVSIHPFKIKISFVLLYSNMQFSSVFETNQV